MNKDNLIKKLDTIEVPDIEIESHKRLLRTALHNAARQGDYRRGIIGNTVKRFLEGMIRFLRQSVWRTAAVGVGALCIVSALILIVPLLARPTPTILATDIVRRSPQVQQMLNGTGDIAVLNVDVKDGTAYVVCGRGMGDIVEAQVDLNSGAVTNLKRFEGLFLPELTQVAQADAVNIALADSRVKEIMSKGGSVKKVFPSFSSISGASVIDGRMVKVLPASSVAVVQIELNAKSWLIQINLDEKRTEKVIESQNQIIPFFDIFNKVKRL